MDGKLILFLNILVQHVEVKRPDITIDYRCLKGDTKYLSRYASSLPSVALGWGVQTHESHVLCVISIQTGMSQVSLST